jgi:hypothetical protein
MDHIDALALRRSLLAASPAASWLDDLKLFSAACLGGLVFFATYIA